MKHTQGNWRYSEMYSLVTTSKEGLIEGNKTICDLRYNSEIQPDECLANGKLIAAAPELLNALQMVIKLNGRNFHDVWFTPDEYELIMSAIQKAVTP